MKRLNSRTKVAIAIGIFILFVLLRIFAPQDQRQIGSTYSKRPDGYGAWYAQVEQQTNVEVQRWRRPVTELVEAHPETGQILLRVSRTRPYVSYADDEGLEEWIEAGNTLIQVGYPPQAVSAAPFHSQVPSDYGAVVLDTRRRGEFPQAHEPDITVYLQDAHGAIAWGYPAEEGQRIQVAIADLGANAYQDAPGNLDFLTSLLTAQAPDPATKEVVFTANATTLWVDEYIHGHVDTPPDDVAEDARDIWGYLSRTPLVIVALQGAIAFIILVLALNRRFGRPQPLSDPPTNNTQAYVSALAAVLSKAEQQQFVLSQLAPQQQRQLQQALGLGTTLIDDTELMAAWATQTGQKSNLLQKLLRQGRRDRPLSKAQLVQWLQGWQSLHNTLHS